MSLLLAHPELPSCADCQKYVYDPKTWEVVRRPARTGLPMVRPANQPPPCYQCPKIPSGADPVPSSAVELTLPNWQTYLLYLEIKAGAAMPEDAIFRRNCALLRNVEDRHDRGTTGANAQLLGMMGKLMAAGLTTKRK